MERSFLKRLNALVSLPQVAVVVALVVYGSVLVHSATSRSRFALR